MPREYEDFITESKKEIKYLRIVLDDIFEDFDLEAYGFNKSEVQKDMKTIKGELKKLLTLFYDRYSEDIEKILEEYDSSDDEKILKLLKKAPLFLGWMNETKKNQNSDDYGNIVATVSIIAGTLINEDGWDKVSALKFGNNLMKHINDELGLEGDDALDVQERKMIEAFFKTSVKAINFFKSFHKTITGDKIDGYFEEYAAAISEIEDRAETVMESKNAIDQEIEEIEADDEEIELLLAE